MPVAEYERRTTTEQRERLSQLASVLKLGRHTFHAQGNLFGWQPKKGSTGADDFDAAERGDRLARLATRAPAAASLMIRTAGEQLAGLAVLFRAGEVFGAAEPVVRSVLENSAYACWIIDSQSTRTSRGARLLSTELTTVDHLRAAIKELSGTDDHEYAELATRFDDLVASAEEFYSPFTPPKGNNHRYTVGGEQYPTFTQAVVAWADGPGGGSVSGQGIYGLLCGDTHPKALAARLNWSFGGRQGWAEQHMTVPHLERLVTAALSPYCGALVNLAAHQGWLGNPVLADFEAACAAIAPGALG